MHISQTNDHGLATRTHTHSESTSMGEWFKQSKHTDLRLEAIGRTRVLGIKDGQCSIPESHKHTAFKVPAMMEKVNGPDTIFITKWLYYYGSSVTQKKTENHQ